MSILTFRNFTFRMRNPARSLHGLFDHSLSLERDRHRQTREKMSDDESNFSNKDDVANHCKGLCLEYENKIMEIGDINAQKKPLQDRLKGLNQEKKALEDEIAHSLDILGMKRVRLPSEGCVILSKRQKKESLTKKEVWQEKATDFFRERQMNDPEQMAEDMVSFVDGKRESTEVVKVSYRKSRKKADDDEDDEELDGDE